MADVKVLAESLVSLTVKEVQELAEFLKSEYGIEPAAATPFGRSTYIVSPELTFAATLSRATITVPDRSAFTVVVTLNDTSDTTIIAINFIKFWVLDINFF